MFMLQVRRHRTAPSQTLLYYGSDLKVLQKHLPTQKQNETKTVETRKHVQNNIMLNLWTDFLK